MPRTTRNDGTLTVGLHYQFPGALSFTTKRVILEDMAEYHRLQEWLCLARTQVWTNSLPADGFKPFFKGANFFIPTMEHLYLVTLMDGPE